MNSPKERMTGRVPVSKVANVLAASLTVAAGTGLAATAQEALRNAPPAIAQKAPEQDPLSRKPPTGVVFPEIAPIRQAQGGTFLFQG